MPNPSGQNSEVDSQTNDRLCLVIHFTNLSQSQNLFAVRKILGQQYSKWKILQWVDTMKKLKKLLLLDPLKNNGGTKKTFIQPFCKNIDKLLSRFYSKIIAVKKIQFLFTEKYFKFTLTLVYCVRRKTTFGISK